MKVTLTPTQGEPKVEPNILVQGFRFDLVDSFVDLSSSLSRNVSLDHEVNLMIQKASTTDSWKQG